MDRSSPQCSSPDCSFNDASINCKGSCRQRFHAVCVGLSAASVPVIASSSSFFWFCDVCRDHIRTGQTTVAVRSVEGSPGEGKGCGSTSCSFTDQLVTCDGPCGKDFHGMCVQLNKADLSVIGSSSNIVWFCTTCKLHVIPALDCSDGFTEPSNKLDNPPDSSPNPEEINSGEVPAVKDPVVESPTINDQYRENERGNPDSSSYSEGSSIYDDPSMNNLESPESGELEDSENDARSSNDSLGISNDEPSSTQLNVWAYSEVSKFNGKSETAPTMGTADLSPTPSTKPVKEENDNSPAPRKRPLDTDSTIEAIASKTVKKSSSIFSLYLRFSVPNLSERSAENAVRKALGLSRSDPVTVWNVVPFHVVFPRYSTFRVDLDAHWKSAALENSTWRFTANYKEHREWSAEKLRD